MECKSLFLIPMSITLHISISNSSNLPALPLLGFKNVMNHSCTSWKASMHLQDTTPTSAKLSPLCTPLYNEHNWPLILRICNQLYSSHHNVQLQISHIISRHYLNILIAHCTSVLIMSYMVVNFTLNHWDSYNYILEHNAVMCYWSY